jgi:hypothetical protein
MENKRGKLAVVLMTLVLLMVLVIGPVAPGVAARAAEPWAGTVVDGLHGLWADPMAGGGSGA